MTNYLQIFISLFSLMNPLVAIPIYLNITKNLSLKERKSIALVCGMAVFTVLALFLLLGYPLMQILGIHDYSLRLGGGLVVLLIGIAMIGSSADKIEDLAEVNKKPNKLKIRSLGISPLALPMVVGPASMVMVVLYGQQAHGVMTKLAILVVIALVSMAVVLVFFLADYIAAAIGEMGIIMLTKIMGVIITAVAIEMMVAGLKDVVPLLING